MEIIHALARIKWAAAKVNGQLQLLDATKASAIAHAALQISQGVYDSAFPLSVWQTGSGTQSNMNVNEVIASLANAHIAALGESKNAMKSGSKHAAKHAAKHVTKHAAKSTPHHATHSEADTETSAAALTPAANTDANTPNHVPSNAPNSVPNGAPPSAPNDAPNGVPNSEPPNAQSGASSHAVHPNDDVNLGQSSNDVFPTAMHLAALQGMHHCLLPALRSLQLALQHKSEAFAELAKVGRTHLQDATPVTLGQEFGGYCAQLALCQTTLLQAMEAVNTLAIGATAVGTRAAGRAFGFSAGAGQ
jgi:fumarate hydratase class II